MVGSAIYISNSARNEFGEYFEIENLCAPVERFETARDFKVKRLDTEIELLNDEFYEESGQVLKSVLTMWTLQRWNLI